MRAKNLILAIGCHSETEVRAMIRFGCLRNFSVTIADEIFGKDFLSFKGNKARRKDKRALLVK